MENKKHSLLSIILFSPVDNRFRSGYRILIQSSLLVFLLFVASIPLVVMSIFGWSIEELDLIIGIGVSFLAITCSIYLSRKFLDHRPFISLGLKLNPSTIPDLMIGFLIPAFMMGLIFFFEWYFSWLTIDDFSWNNHTGQEIIKGLGFDLILYIAVAWQEELLTRGYHLQNLIEGSTVLVGVLTSSFLFSALHILNPHASWKSLIGITIAGIFLCYSYLVTHQLWLPIGLHLGWNFFQGPIFGFPVSGTESFILIDQKPIGPEIITGGYFGPEAGLVLIPALLLGILLIQLYSKHRKT